MQFPDFKRELKYIEEGYHVVAGCDEVGVGPVAGPVVAAACIIDPACIGAYRSKNKWYHRVRDSKTVNEAEREALVSEIISHCVTFGIGEVSAQEIDRINIHNAKLFAMKQAIEQMFAKVGDFSKETQERRAILLIDGVFTIKNLDTPGFDVSQQALVGGDGLALSISAASIIAKVHRDKILKEYDARMPRYGFAKHKGYNTKEHRKAIIDNGITEFHRRSFLKNIMAY